jgi:hypothetical protein
LLSGLVLGLGLNRQLGANAGAKGRWYRLGQISLLIGMANLMLCVAVRALPLNDSFAASRVHFTHFSNPDFHDDPGSKTATTALVAAGF